MTDQLEMVTLDKEFAEEKSETLEAELEAEREKVGGLEVELEVLREENGKHSRVCGTFHAHLGYSPIPSL